MGKQSKSAINSSKAKTILVVDDMQEISLFLAEFLRSKGYKVISANSGEEALAVYTSAKPNLILTDIMMPGISGLELAETIRRRDQTTPIITLSGYASVQSAVEAFRTGVNEFLIKPIAFDEIASTIEKLLSMSSEELEIRQLKEWVANLKEDNKRLSERLKEQETESSTQINSDENETFYFTLVHDMSGEIAALGFFIQNIRKEIPDSADIQEICDYMERGVSYLRNLILRMKHRIGIDKLVMESVSVSELVKKAELTIQPRIRSNIQFDITDNQSTNEGKVLVDAEQLIGVLLEIINNAVHALRDNKGIIKLDFSIRGSLLLITVTNNGPVIPKEISEKIFKERVRSSKEKGMGMGLFLANKVINALGGTISLDYSSPEWTVFAIELPLYKPQKGN
jgi:DNA-binding response OmpR family regulator